MRGSPTLAELAISPISTASVLAVHHTDPASLAPDQQAAFLALCNRVEAHIAARRLQTVNALAGTGSTPEPFVETEVAIALRMPLGAAVAELHRARHAARMLPQTLASLARGDITAGQVRAMVDATSHVEDAVVCSAVERHVLARAGSQTSAQTRRSAIRTVAALDPAAFERSARHARSAADVTLTPVEDSMALLTAYLPLSDAAIAMQTVDADARAAKAAGDGRPLGVLRVTSLVNRVLADTAEGRPTTHRSHGRQVEVHVVATPQTLLGLAETPGEIPGVGPIPASTVRELARDAALRWLTIDPSTGALYGLGERRYRPTAGLAAAVSATWVSSAAPGSSIPATRCDLDHLRPYPAGATDATNLAPVDRRWHRAKTLAGVTVCRRDDGSLEWTTPRGQRVVVAPYDYRLGP